MLNKTTLLPRNSENDNGTPESYNNTIKSPISADGTPEKGKTYKVPARQGVAVKVKANETLKIINTHGTQVCDFWLFNAHDLSEFFSSEHLRGAIGRVNPKVGDTLLSNRREAIAKFIADTSPGVHDTIVAACDLARYRSLGHEGYHDNCADNLRQALLAIGIRCREIPQPFNLWMNIPINPDHSIDFLPCASKKGDYVEFVASKDCIAVMSACPMDLSDINSKNPVELEFTVY